MGISNNLADIEQNFLLLGLVDNTWEPFRKNVKYDAFSVRRKTIDLLYMKEEKVKYTKKELPKGVTYNPELDGKYDNEPLFKEKIDRANEIIKKAGVPKL